MNNTKIDSNENIKESLIKACTKSRPKFFKQFLSSEKVNTKWEDKESFYKFFKYILTTSKKTSEGELHCKIKLLKKENKNVQYYEFYDTVHLHSRLTLIIEESKDNILIDILPF
jgi:hypothetical protein